MKRNMWMGGLAVALTLSTVDLAVAASVGQDGGPASAAARPAPPKLAPPKPGGLGRGLIERIEDKLDRALTSGEKKEIGDALKTAEQALKDAQDELVEALADATGLSVDKVKTALKGAGTGPAIMANLEAQLGRKLTRAERAEVNLALRARGAAKKAAMDILAATISSITGIETDEVHELLKPPPPPKKDGDKPQGGKPDCDKPQGDKPQGGKPAENPDGGTGGY